MEVKARLRYLRMSPRKVRYVVDQVRGKMVSDAINKLKFGKRAACKPVYKLVKSAVANAMETGKIDIDNLFIDKIYVDEGPTLKRYRPRAMGRATIIRKRTSHITVILKEI
jgi:large subunit ribosomal protein L22